MKKIMIFGIAISLAISSCTTSVVPLTGRKVSTFGVSAAELEQQAAIGYSQLLSDPSTKVVSSNSTQTQMVKRVGQKIAAAVTQYMNANGYGEQIKNYKWEFNVIESKEINAWCMPGGKVAVYTGILPITRDEAGLATVMGHEIAHAIAQHSLERASTMLKAQLGSAVVGAAVSGKSESSQAVVNQLFGIGAQTAYVLPNSRNQELEADKMGLSFMAMAGYNPQNAINFWQRMAAASDSSAKPPVFLSTHPTDQSRIAQIQKDLPEAMKYYKGR
ncbi:M48 family metallopeptidase [Pedobacter boryungensis]|uniref:M48 family metallopeptidase n=1 Tax=Pedobacter boryungensis TaxID=869962 RepID=A0ABX2DG02_9SPHI|nr:M48 family metallopeptidase [Pedobacter boryungensis]NQX33032.1 M48 family metallopeptidase [Pedobacter boryungensis]